MSPDEAQDSIVVIADQGQVEEAPRPADTPPKLEVRPLDDVELESIDAGAFSLVRVSNDDLQEAALKNDLGLVRRLTQAGASVNAPMRAECSDDFGTILHVLASKPQIPNGARIMMEICKGRANLNARSTSGTTPLMQACQRKHVAAVEVLLNAGAEWQPVDDAGMTCMQYCVVIDVGYSRQVNENLCVELLELLNSAGVGLNHGGKDSPATEAVLEQNLPALQALLDLGADPDGINEAAEGATTEFLKLLIDREANPFHRNKEHKNAMDLAILRGDHEITTMLRDYIGSLQRQRHPHLQTLEDEPEPFPAVEEDRRGDRASLLHHHFHHHRHKAHKRKCWRCCISDEMLWRGKVLSIQVAMNPYWHYLVVMTIVVAIYFPELYVITGLDEDTLLNVVLVLIALVWGLEGIVHALADGAVYIGKFFFWIDVVGMISVMLELSIVRNFARSLNDDAYGATTLDKAAPVKLLRLLIRGGQMLKLLKLLRFLPSKRKAEVAKGTSKTMSWSLGALLSARLGILIAVLALFVPCLEIYTYPAIDWSMRMWVEDLEWKATNLPSVLADRVSDLESFYSDERHTPFEVNVATARGEQLQVWLLTDAPSIDYDRIRVVSRSGASYIDFDFSSTVRISALSNILLATLLIVIILFASWLTQRSVTKVLFLPLDGLLRSIRHTARSIIKSITAMAGKISDEAALNQGVKLATARSTDTVGREVSLGEEMELLEKVLAKLQVLQDMTRKNDSHKDNEDIDEHQKALLAAHEVPIHAMTAAYSINGQGGLVLEMVSSFADFEDIKLTVEERCEARLFDAGMAYDSLLNWGFDVFHLTQIQCQELGLAMLEFYRPPEVGSELTSAYRNFIAELQQRYRSPEEVSYHNFLHGIDVTCMVFRLLQICNAPGYFATRDLWALMVSALAHDVGHLGVHNAFLVETQHELAIRYNDQSPLENMHCATLFEIAADPDKHIFAGLDRHDYRHLRHTIVEAILNTDAHTHFARIKELKFIYESSQELFDSAHQKHKNTHTHKPEFPSPAVHDIFVRHEVTRQLRNLFLYFADVSNPMRPWEPCRQWASRIMEEFAQQGDRERALGLPVHGLHDRNTINMAYSQIGFIEYFTSPLAFIAARLLPPLDICDEMLITNANYWYEEWLDSAYPPPSHGERVKLRERIQRMEGKCP